MKVLVLGGYGLIGLAIVKRLLREGLEVVGLGRSRSESDRYADLCNWVVVDLATLTEKTQWYPHISGIDIVVNAAGVLQSSWHTSVSAVQDTAMTALIDACESKSTVRFIQISAPGASDTSSTEFFRSKFQADLHLMGSALEWTILKPGLVLSPQAFGGTSLLRTIAIFPGVQPIVLKNQRLQTVLIDDVSDAVIECIRNEHTISVAYDLMETKSHSLEEIVASFRKWLGLNQTAYCMTIPHFIAWLLSKAADLAGQLGWRSPLRSTALNVLKDDVIGSPSAWIQTTGMTPKTLQQSLELIPSTRQERLYARVQLAFPIVLVCIACFWIFSGVIGLARLDHAAAVLQPALGSKLAAVLVIIGSIADIAIGFAFFVRRFFQMACIASLIVSVGYLVMGSIITPFLWLDPLGPLMKIIPPIAISMLLLTMTDDR